MILDTRTNMSSKISSSDQGTEERGGDDDELHSDNNNEKETSISTCTISSSSSGLIGYKRNHVFDCSLISEIGDHDDDDDDEFDSESEEEEEELFEINLNFLNKKEALPLDTIIEEDYCCDESTVFSLDIHHHNCKDIVDDAAVYVAVGHLDGDSSMGALSWALNHAVTPSTTVYLLHVFPEIKLIPSPLGKIPRSHVNLEYVNHYLNQKKGTSKLLLQKFIDLCVHSKVKVEMILMEGDNIAEAILDLIGKHDIRKLVIGTTASNLRESGGGSSRRQNDIANKVLKNAQESCDVKIICEGRVVLKEMIGYNSSSSRSKESSGSSSSSQDEVENRARAVAPLMRFMTIPMWLFRTRFSSPR